jgi:FkbM family methyltransferase
MFRPKAFTNEIDTTGLSMNHVAHIWHTMNVSKNYDWWYEVLPDDVVVDVGAGVGIFSAKALDADATKVYMIEPNRDLLRTAIANVSDYIMDQEARKVFPINAAIGKTDADLSKIHKITGRETAEPRLMSLMQFAEEQKLDKIDFLKINASGAEMSILDPNAIEFLTTRVRHIAAVIHLDQQYGAIEKFKTWREKLLKPLMDRGVVRFQDDRYGKFAFEENFFELLPAAFMVYITNY